MSHIVTIRTEVRDPAALQAACSRLKLPVPQNGRIQLFNDAAEGWAVQLPGWRYPAVFDVAAGTGRFDNFEGRWGDQRELDRLLQAYAVEKAKLESRRKGYSVSESLLADGSIQLEIQVNGVAS